MRTTRVHRIVVSLPILVLVMTAATPAAAAPAADSAEARPAPVADHLGGALTLCGRVLEYVEPMPGTDGSLTVHGVVEYGDHAFVIADSVPADATLTALAGALAWTCLDVVGDGMGVLTSVSVAAATTLCGRIEPTIDALGHRQEMTTLVLDGEAATLLAGEPALAMMLDALAVVAADVLVPPGVACLDVALAGDGTLAAILLQYDFDGLMAPIACGLVAGTPIAYRDPASQLYPEETSIAVDGFVVDASLVAAPFQAVLSHHLDAGIDLCLLVRVVDSGVVDAATLTLGDPVVCGALEVRGGLVFVDAVVVSQALTALNFADPAHADLDGACSDVRSQQAAAVASLSMCGRLDAIGESTFTVDGTTFHLEAPLTADAGLVVGAEQAVRLDGPNPFQLFGAANPARLTPGSIDGCALVPVLPDVAMADPADRVTSAAARSAGAWLVGMAVLLLVFSKRAAWRRSDWAHRP